ncbi:MAG: serine/threonine protein kinase [Deltaproteobacteria bacterium]|nr:serine/threonine protein kinase [Deltaproteobacteria bacterium]
MTVNPGERRLDPVEALPPGALTGATLDGRYLVEGMLGEGGMGVVYAARHVHLEKRLAVKVLRQDASRDPDLVDRFQREARAATAIGSEHIVDISDFGKTPDGSTYFVMEFLAGSSLGDVLAAGPMSLARTLHVGKQICEALGAAHQRGIVHRDLKPDNIYLVRRGGDANFVKVLDFGIAKVGKGAKRLTVVGQVFGTPHYMSPEQAAGEPVDGRSDIYALGVILYEASTGQVPFDSEQPMAILTKHLYQDPVPPRQTPAGAQIPPRFEALILRCLAKKPDDRPATMEDVAVELESLEFDLPTGVRASLGLRLTDSQAEYRLSGDGSGGYRVPRLDVLSQSSERDVALLSPPAGIPLSPSIELGSDPGATATARTPATTGVQARATRDDAETLVPPRRSAAPMVIAVLAVLLVLVGGGIGLKLWLGSSSGATAASQAVSPDPPAATVGSTTATVGSTTATVGTTTTTATAGATTGEQASASNAAPEAPPPGAGSTAQAADVAAQAPEPPADDPSAATAEQDESGGSRGSRRGPRRNGARTTRPSVSTPSVEPRRAPLVPRTPPPTPGRQLRDPWGSR